MTNQTNVQGGADLGCALECMKTALDILDASGAPADIGAHLDMAINRLLQEIEVRGPLRGTQAA